VKKAGARLAPEWRVSSWIVASSVALLATSRWLSATSVEYLVVAATATAAAGALIVWLASPPRPWAIACVVSLALNVALGANTQHRLARFEGDWTAEGARMSVDAVDELEDRVAGAVRGLGELAERALQAPDDRASAFEYLASARRNSDQAIVLFRGDSAYAWSGRSHVLVDTGTSSGVVGTPFYLGLYSAKQADGARAVATQVLYTVSPADRIAASLAGDVAASAGVAGFRFAPASDSASLGRSRVVRADGRALFAARAELLTQGEVRLRTLERARLLVGLLLGVALAAFVVAAWRVWRALPSRLGLVGVGLVCVAFTPLSAYSNYSRLFDPTLFFTSLGGPLTANAAALAFTSALVLLTLLAVVRRQTYLPDRPLAIVIVLVVAGLGPFLLRDLARGIQIPSYGVSAALWLIWEVPLFLAAVAVMLTGAAAGSAALGRSRGLHPVVAPALSVLASLLAPVVWQAPGQWPWWYTFLWIAAIASLAVSRRTAAVIAAAATVAALGATTLVWGATTRARVRLAEADVTMLGAGDNAARALAERLRDRVSRTAPLTRQGLLEVYATSDLAAAGYPSSLAVWRRGAEAPVASLATAELNVPLDSLRRVVEAASAERRPVSADLPGVPALEHAIAIPTDSGVVTIVVAPPSRLIPADPFARLLGIETPPEVEPPYTVQIAPLGRSATSTTPPNWRREGTELHGDWTAQTGSGVARVHAEVELRPLFALTQRGTLIALLNLAIVALLWLTSVLADGIAARWIAVRRRRWARSYRIRLTLALFAFFMVPAVAFAIWSYQQLSTDAARARQLLVRETLRAVNTDSVPAAWLARESRRLQSPLFVYERGELVSASDSLLEDVAPIGRLLGPEIGLALLVQGEVGAHRIERVGRSSTLFGYRAMESDGATVIAAPARADELALGRRARDLGVLVLFATAIGALAALWLSGIAARQLARPIGSLRHAALALAAGEREPRLEGQPTVEFLPVFAAFRRMMQDLNSSRSALEEATRRTATVLRNVASGVIALDDHGVVTLANPRADELLGARLPPGTRLADVGPRELASLVQSFLAGESDEETFEMPHGEQQWRGRLTRLLRGGVVVTLEDVSEIARAQRVLAWGEMARQVAHEIKNPLTPIRLGVQHLRRARADARVDFDRVLEQNVARILKEIDRLDEIARAFSRYGQPPEQRAGAEPTDVASVLRDLVELETMGEEQVRWKVDGVQGPMLALARREELREVLLNVFENARLARAREVQIALDRADGRVRVTVRDDGHGIPAEVLPRIFEPHFSTRTSGSGLGLAVSRRLIESWGGTIDIASADGQGTTVTIRLAHAS
jgi:two-component system nitrogen regulation sensor histidine kinase NtrY